MWVIVHNKQAMLVHVNSSSIRVLMEFYKRARMFINVTAMMFLEQERLPFSLSVV